MKFIDLQQQYQQNKQAIDSAIQAVLDSSQYINGPQIKQLEQSLNQFTGSKHSIGCSSGTTALQIALMALDIGPGDEVITTPFSFFATAEAIVILGATPVFLDIDEKTYNINPELIEEAITDKTKAIMPVSLYGQCANFEAINKIASKYAIPVIEDAAQSLGAKHHGKFSCNLSTIACTSFFPSKPLGGFGDGGACFTNDDKLAEKMRMIVDHGQRARYTHELIGMNGRLDTIQAAVLLAKLPVFIKEIEKRQQVAQWYTHYLGDEVSAPFVEPFNQSVYGQYTIRVKHRAKIAEALLTAGIPTATHYPVSIHRQPCFSGTDMAKQAFPVSDKLTEEVMSLPFHPYMSEDEVKQVANALKTAISSTKELA